MSAPSNDFILTCHSILSQILKFVLIADFLVTLSPFVEFNVFHFNDLAFIGTICFYSIALSAFLFRAPSYYSEDSDWAYFLFYLGCFYGVFAVTFPATLVGSFYWFWGVILLHTAYVVLSAFSYKACWTEVCRYSFTPKESLDAPLYYKFNMCLSWTCRILGAVFVVLFVLLPNIPLPDVDPALVVSWFAVILVVTSIGMDLGKKINQPLKWAAQLIIMGAYSAYPVVQIVFNELQRNEDSVPSEDATKLSDWLPMAIVRGIGMVLITVNIALTFNTLEVHENIIPLGK